MKAKLKVSELRELNNDKGYILAFQTPYGEEISTFFSKDADVQKIKERYPVGRVDVFDIVPYSSKGSLGLSVSAPLTELSEDELF